MFFSHCFPNPQWLRQCVFYRSSQMVMSCFFLRENRVEWVGFGERWVGGEHVAAHAEGGWLCVAQVDRDCWHFFCLTAVIIRMQNHITFGIPRASSKVRWKFPAITKAPSHSKQTYFRCSEKPNTNKWRYFWHNRTAIDQRWNETTKKKVIGERWSPDVSQMVCWCSYHYTIHYILSCN